MGMRFSDVFNTSDFNINNPKLEEMLNKTKGVAETFGKKSVEHWEISRKRVEFLDTKAKLSKLYEAYGKNQYKMLNGAAVDEAELQTQVDEIGRLEEKKAVLTDEIDLAKAEFNESVINMAQKTKEAFQRDSAPAEEVEINPYDMFESDDE
ncbi:MAG: hypothetical protein NC397_06675 [Clostridium sp.]|nr:hypothetical protein [Clostridium sp.]